MPAEEERERKESIAKKMNFPRGTRITKRRQLERNANRRKRKRIEIKMSDLAYVNKMELCLQHKPSWTIIPPKQIQAKRICFERHFPSDGISQMTIITIIIIIRCHEAIPPDSKSDARNGAISAPSSESGPQAPSPTSTDWKIKFLIEKKSVRQFIGKGKLIKKKKLIKQFEIQ